jgi:preprotein translocase subunit SecD
VRRTLAGLLIVLALAWGSLAAVLAAGIRPQLGLDLQGGTSVLLAAPAGTPSDVLDVSVDIMRQRIEDIGGVQEPEIVVSGTSVLVQLPGVQDEERALEAVGRTGLLSFRPVLGAYPGGTGPLAGADEVPPGIDPITGLTIIDDPDLEVAYLLTAEDASGFTEVLQVGAAGLLGSDVADAVPLFDTTTSQWVVSLDLTSAGGAAFAELTGEAANYPAGDPRRRIAIVLDGSVVSAPQVSPEILPGVGITGGRAIITVGTGPTAEDDAKDLAVVLRYGSLPVSFTIDAVEKVSATLGTDSLRAGLLAGAIGLVLVALVLLTYYRVLGVVAIVGLTVFGSLLITIFALFGRGAGLTLTLAGVTGLIVSVGITADSYIVYFERVKDLVRDGVPPPEAATEGFRLAFRTILTADTVSFLGAALLWLLAVGPVRGFALSLGIATILDVIIVRAYTRRAVSLLANSPLAEDGPLSIRAAAGVPAPAAAVEVPA